MRPKTTKRIFAMVLIVAGVILLGSLASPTGAVIGVKIPAQVASLGLLFLAGGLFLLLAEQTYEAKKKQIRHIVEAYDNNEITSFAAVAMMREVEPIKFIKFTTEKKHTMGGELNGYPIYLKKGKKAKDLALVEYLEAQHSHPREFQRYSEMQFKAGSATKHYSPGFKKELNKFKQQHHKELELILGIA